MHQGAPQRKLAGIDERWKLAGQFREGGVEAMPPNRRESYAPLTDNPWKSPFDDPQSTFATDVDTAAYTNLRRMIRLSQASGASPLHEDRISRPG